MANSSQSDLLGERQVKVVPTLRGGSGSCHGVTRLLSGKSSLAGRLRAGAEITVVADAASVGSDAGSIRHDGTLIDAPVALRQLVQQTSDEEAGGSCRASRDEDRSHTHWNVALESHTVSPGSEPMH